MFLHFTVSLTAETQGPRAAGCRPGSHGHRRSNWEGPKGVGGEDLPLVPTSDGLQPNPDRKKASKPAKTKLEGKETPIRPPEAGFVFV